MDVDLSLVAPELPGNASAFLESSGLESERVDTVSAARADFTLVAERALAPELLEALWTKRGEAEAVVASRYVRGAHGGSFPSRWVNRFARRALDLPCFDLTSSVHLYRTSALRRVDAAAASSGAEILVRLVNGGFKIKEVAWDGGVGPEKLASQLAALPRLRRLRRAPGAADADDHTLERAGRFRRRKLERRQAAIVGFLEVDVPVLDVGCGSSRLVQTLSKGVGLDRDPAKIRFLRGRARAAACGELRQLPFQTGSFPQLVLADVPFEEGDVAELKRVLTPRGTLVVATPRATAPRVEADLAKRGFFVGEVRRIGKETILRAVLR